MLPSSFTRFELTEAEEKQAFLISPQTEAMLRNQMADVAEEMMANIFKSKLTAPEERESIRYLQGQLDAFKFLLEGVRLEEEVQQEQSNTGE